MKQSDCRFLSVGVRGPRRTPPGWILAVAVAGLCVILPARAYAWEPATHVSIVLGALRLAPGLEPEAVPATYRDGFIRNVERGDIRSTTCLDHLGPRAKYPALTEAARIFAELTGPNAEQRPYQRALLLGSLLHYVGDLITPSSLAAGRREFDPDFFSNKDFAIFREPGQLPDDFVEAMKARSAQAQWGDETPGIQPAVFRLAINTTLDVLSRISPRAAAAVASAPPGVVFLVNRIDNGTGGPDWAMSGWGTRLKGEARADLLHQDGVRVVEWQRRKTGSSWTFQALLLNNRKSCSSRITVGAATWSVALPDIRMSPGSLQKVVFEVPGDGNVGELSALGHTADCPAVEPPGSVPTNRRLVLHAGLVPRFEGEFQEVKVSPERPAARVRADH